MVQSSVCTFPFSQTLIEKYTQLSTPGKRLTPAKKAYFNEHFYKKRKEIWHKQ